MLHQASLRSSRYIDNVLEPRKVASKLTGFLNGADNDLHFVLSILAFDAWLDAYVTNPLDRPKPCS